METVNGTSLNGSSPKGSWLAPAIWSFDGRDLAIVDTGWVDLVRRKPVDVVDESLPTTVDPLTWPPPANFEAERARLEAAIAEAQERASATKVRVAIGQARIQAALRVELDEFQQSLAELERKHEEDLATIRTEAQAEVDRIRAGRQVNDAE